MKSDVYNLKLIFKIILGKSKEEDLYELIHILMKDKKEIFYSILLIYGKIY